MHPQITLSERLDIQENRAIRLGTYRREAVGLANAIDEHLKRQAKPEPTVARAVVALRTCARHSVARQYSDGYIQPLAAATCKHKICPVCNALKSRRIRSGYWQFFTAHDGLLTQYDFFHLVLTVPHSLADSLTEVYDKLIVAFNELRKTRQWRQQVWAGLRNVETTSGANGWHVHIHSLLLVYRVERSRNRLYTLILKSWNLLTIDERKPPAPMSQSQRQGIAAGLLFLPAQDRERLLEALDSRGATVVSLESLYYYTKKGKKRYARKPEEMLAGIMEAIKYQFEPMALKDDNHTYQTDLIVAILPGIYKKRLFATFGAFYGKNEYSQILQRFLKPENETEHAIEQYARETVEHPVTGLPADSYRYIAIKTAGIYRQQGRLTIAGEHKPLNAHSLREAMEQLTHMAVSDQINEKNKTGQA